jgi:hypothetical protein
MAARPPTTTNYGELFSNPAFNHFGTEDEAVLQGYLAMDSLWRATHDPLSVEALHQNILADFCRPIGETGVFVQDEESGTGRIKLIHAIHSFPGAPGLIRDRMVTMGFEGEVSGVDVCTVAFDATQLSITDDIVVPGTLERLQKLLGKEPGRVRLGPFKGTANTRTTKTRGMAYFPFEILGPLLGADITAHQAFELVVPSLVDAGLEVACAGLVNFLTVALVQPTEEQDAPLTVHPQAGKPGYLPGPVAINYHRENVL